MRPFDCAWLSPGSKVRSSPVSPTLIPPPPVGRLVGAEYSGGACRISNLGSGGGPFILIGGGGATFSKAILGLESAGGGGASGIVPFGFGATMDGGSGGGWAAATWIFGGS